MLRQHVHPHDDLSSLVQQAADQESAVMASLTEGFLPGDLVTAANKLKVQSRKKNTHQSFSLSKSPCFLSALAQKGSSCYYSRESQGLGLVPMNKGTPEQTFRNVKKVDSSMKTFLMSLRFPSEVFTGGSVKKMHIHAELFSPNSPPEQGSPAANIPLLSLESHQCYSFLSFF